VQDEGPARSLFAHCHWVCDLLIEHNMVDVVQIDGRNVNETFQRLLQNFEAKLPKKVGGGCGGAMVDPSLFIGLFEEIKTFETLGEREVLEHGKQMFAQADKLRVAFDDLQQQGITVSECLCMFFIIHIIFLLCIRILLRTRKFWKS